MGLPRGVAPEPAEGVREYMEDGPFDLSARQHF